MAFGSAPCLSSAFPGVLANDRGTVGWPGTVVISGSLRGSWLQAVVASGCDARLGTSCWLLLVGPDGARGAGKWEPALGVL